MINALAEAVSAHVKTEYRLGTRMEGRPQNGWLLADYGDIVVHIFSAEQRDYYKLDELWSDGKILVHLQ